jgi:hypothetical protein
MFDQGRKNMTLSIVLICFLRPQIVNKRYQTFQIKELLANLNCLT